MPKDIQIRIAHTTIGLDRSGVQFRVQLDPSYQPFLAEGERDLTVRLKGGIPEFSTYEVVFDASPVWTLYKNCNRSIIRAFPEESVPFLERVLSFDSELQSVDLYIRPNPVCSNLPLDPMVHPVGELFMINYLSTGKGIILHSCGIEIDGRGFLFLGVSGAGKSTMASLWEKRKDVTILSDDRIIVRKRDGIFWAYGTPWHGDVKLASPKGVPLEQIFFIRHDSKNRVSRMQGVENTCKHLVCAFPPFWDPKGMSFTLEFLAELSKGVRCHELGFVPDQSAVNFIISTISQK